MRSKVNLHNYEAEKYLLACFMTRFSFGRDAVEEIVEQISVDDFAHHKNKSIYSAMLSLYNKGVKVDIVTLSDALTEQGSMSDIGIEYVSALFDLVS